MRRAAGLLAALALLLSGCATVQQVLDQRPTASVAGVEFTHLSPTEVIAAFQVEIANPYPVDLPLLDLDYALRSDRRVLVEGETDLTDRVPAGGTRVVVLPVRLVPADLLTTLADLRPGAVLPYRAELGLSVDPPATDRLRLPLTHQGELPVPAAPTVRLASIEWTELGLSTVAGTAALQVDNPNAFGLDLSQLGVDLSLAGRPVARLSAESGARWEAGGTETLRLPLSFSPTELGAAALSLLRGEGADYRLDGGMTVQTRFGAVELPLSGSGETDFTR